MHDLARDLWANNPRAETQDIHIVVLDALMSRVVIVAQASTNAREFVCGDTGPYTTATDDNRPLRSTVSDRLASQPRIVRIVGRRAGLMRPQIHNGIASGRQLLDHHLFQWKPGVVCCYRDLHAVTSTSNEVYPL
jgi:hypothetical protein